MSQTVHVLVITHRQGYNLHVYSNGQAPLDTLDRYVVNNWKQEMGDELMSDQPGIRIQDFFFENDRTFYDIEEVVVDQEE